MTKIILLVLGILAGYYSYLYFQEKDDEISQGEPEVEIISQGKEIRQVKPVPHKSDVVKSDISKEEKEGSLKENTSWEAVTQDIFKTQEDLKDYQVMQAAFEEDRMDAYDEFMETRGQSEQGFRITELEEGKYKKIEEQYLKAFEKRFGKEVLLKYLEALDNYNDSSTNERISF